MLLGHKFFLSTPFNKCDLHHCCLISGLGSCLNLQTKSLLALFILSKQVPEDAINKNNLKIFICLAFTFTLHDQKPLSCSKTLFYNSSLFARASWLFLNLAKYKQNKLFLIVSKSPEVDSFSSFRFDSSLDTHWPVVRRL